MARRRTRISGEFDTFEQIEDDFYNPEVDDSGNIRRKKMKGGDY
jgi:hypothetical protein